MTTDLRQPCEYHIQFVQDVATIKETLKNIHEIISNHWKEIEKERDVVREKISLIDKHTILLNGIASEKLNSVKAAQYRVGIIVGLICSIPSFIMIALKILEMINR